MRRISFLVLSLFAFSAFVFAEIPQGFSYQAVVRNSNNAIVANSNIVVTFSILQGSSSGSVVYKEEHSVNTNANGLFTVVLGQGTVKTGNFAGINWSAGQFFLKTESSYGESVTQLLSVPYAMYSGKTLGSYTKDEVDNKMVEARRDAIMSMVSLDKSTIKGVFSVADDRMVYFSKGNLQYNPSTSEWRFAQHQYDCIGTDNTNISSTYEGWIDLFGWGTSGYSGSQPYNTSTSYSEYGPQQSQNLIESNENYDWGIFNVINNGGNAKGLWRTPTREEWDYIIERDGGSKYGVASVDGVNGCILLPDNWVIPQGLSFTSGMAFSEGAEYYSEVNSYSALEWSRMEAAGAVFLPATGYREGTTVENVNKSGSYWSSTAGTTRSDFAFRISFYSNQIGVGDDRRTLGRTVRLVRDVK
ncbi:MAG: hypothetical protein J6Y82_11090 [Bacteroidales bacterium]|nr:hypothetical protein [Bacteroidales bacterium]